MGSKFDIPLMVRVAKMYYESSMKQEEIARELKLSRSLISMILTEAREAGIVEIKVRDPQLNNDDLATKFKEEFNLQNCVIVPTLVQENNTLRKLVAQRAVEIFNQVVESKCNVGIAWGRTCYEFIINYSTKTAFEDIKIIPLIGGSNQNACYFQINEMVRLFSEKINGTPYFIHAPAINSSVEEKELFLKSSNMQPIINEWNNIDLIVTGVGTIADLNNIERETYTGETEIYNHIQTSKAVGDICARYFNIRGKFIKGEYFNRIMGIPLKKLKCAKTVIGIATGTDKEKAILGALRTGIFNIFITDEQTAKAVLKLISQN